LVDSDCVYDERVRGHALGSGSAYVHVLLLLLPTSVDSDCVYDECVRGHVLGSGSVCVHVLLLLLPAAAAG
jgi:hypothetical protein